MPNAALFTAGPPNARFNILHVYGSPYDMGVAQAKLFGEELVQFALGTYAYLIEEGMSSFPSDRIPSVLQALALEKGMDVALQWCAKETAPYTPQGFFDEIQGLADGSGLPYDMLLHLNLFPEITKAACSFFGAWGDATSDGHAYQLRALDYITDCKAFTDYAMVTVYHPTDGAAHAAVGWPGTVGVLTGINANQIALSEIGVSFPDDSFGQGTDNTPPQKVKGQPWMSVLKDVQLKATSLDSALEIIQSAERTCNLIIGVGDGKSGQVNGVEYSGRVAVPYDDVSLLPVNSTWHPTVPGVVYNGMDWLCPGFTSKLGEQLSEHRGSIDAAVTVGNILPTVQTGNLHAAVFDLTASLMHVSFMRRTGADPAEPEFAYERQFTTLDMQALFAQPPPTA